MVECARVFDLVRNWTLWGEEAGRPDGSEHSEYVDNQTLFDDHATEAPTPENNNIVAIER